MLNLPQPNFIGGVRGLPEHYHLVGVYGTLKRGESNHRIIEAAYCIGLGYVNGHKLVSYGNYPVMTPDDENPSRELPVELYAVTDAQLLAMDDLVVHPHYHERSKLTAMGAPVGADPWVYVVPKDRVREDAPIIEGGAWYTATRP